MTRRAESCAATTTPLTAAGVCGEAWSHVWRVGCEHFVGAGRSTKHSVRDCQRTHNSTAHCRTDVGTDILAGRCKRSGRTPRNEHESSLRFLSASSRLICGCLKALWPPGKACVFVYSTEHGLRVNGSWANALKKNLRDDSAIPYWGARRGAPR